MRGVWSVTTDGVATDILLSQVNGCLSRPPRYHSSKTRSIDNSKNAHHHPEIRNWACSRFSAGHDCLCKNPATDIWHSDVDEPCKRTGETYLPHQQVTFSFKDQRADLVVRGLDTRAYVWLIQFTKSLSISLLLPSSVEHLGLNSSNVQLPLVSCLLRICPWVLIIVWGRAQ